MNPTYKTILQNNFHRFQADISMATISEWEQGFVREDLPVYYRFWYIRSGLGWLDLDGRCYSLEPGRLYLLPAGMIQRFGNHQAEPVEIFWCNFRPASGTVPFEEFPLSVVPLRSDDMEQSFIRLVQTFNSEAFTRELRVRAAFLDIVAAYLDLCAFCDSDEDNDLTGKLEPVFDYIENHLAENIVVDDLARLAYLHPNYFIGYFKTMTGCSPIQYVNNRRLEAARRMLQETDIRVTEIAASVGMQNHYLSRLFRQYYGVTPSRYRQIYQTDVISRVNDREGSEV
ncbi:AraC-like DNA-binding protein [Paenibacillus phyllosphaerae]|uniref:AraC-like DNA-binding protein n=1 Tax=Paenibacillus phyllosphaerae TaxID=274593 RepID=A0A7W5B236_9BACL|nr:AraC family transcriptional regulator [Paenibacillus phyllosphaerae]MBB3113010.1 AraC-like DNA-binding protein [Paenibacillus phyllosphaerae]